MTNSATSLVIIWDNFTLGKAYPYLATLLAFMASLPSLFEKYDRCFDKITTGIAAAKKHINSAVVMTLENNAVSAVQSAREKKLNQFVRIAQAENVTKDSKPNLLLASKRFPLERIIDDKKLDLASKVVHLEGIFDDKECDLRNIPSKLRKKQADVDQYDSVYVYIVT